MKLRSASATSSTSRRRVSDGISGMQGPNLAGILIESVINTINIEAGNNVKNNTM